jgi:short-subunit dehydrogenase
MAGPKISLKGQTALVTGASSGIGAAIARELARQGVHLILVARSRPPLEQLASEIRDVCPVAVCVLTQDLAEPDAARSLQQTLDEQNLKVDLLINNAGAGKSGPFLDLPLSEVEAQIQLNLLALTELCQLFAAPMVRRGYGQILNVASTGAYQPGPYTAVYYAAKAYVHSFSLALARELCGTGVTVTLLCPGATATDFSRRAGKKDLANAMPPAKVARAAVRGLLSRRRLVIPGFANRVVITASKVLPGHWLAAIVARIQQPLLQPAEPGRERQ